MQPTVADHPTPEELMAYVDGESSPQVSDHVEGCAACSNESNAVATAQSSLRRSLYRFDCPAPLRLGEYALDVLEPDERRRIASHAVECAECGSELRMLREFLARDVTAPEPLLDQVRRVFANLLTPTPGPALAGVRGTEAPLRQYRVDNAQISLGQGAEPGSLIGLLAIDDAQPVGGQVHLVATQGERRTTDLDDLGNFEFEDVPAGMYALEIHLPDQVIVIDELRVD